MRSLLDLAPLALLGILFVCLWALRVAARQARRSGRRMARHLERRLAEAALAGLAYIVFGRWLRRARRRPAVLEGDDVYRTCTLTPWTGNPNTCRWCDRPLPERSSRWCSPQCSKAARQNHVFGGPGGARDAALERDGYACVRPRCGAVGTQAHALEVNHRIELALGRHGVTSCVHHLSNLETLCHRHHAEVTARQRRNGEFRRTGRIWA